MKRVRGRAKRRCDRALSLPRGGSRSFMRSSASSLTAGESAIKCASPRNVLKDTDDHRSYRARSNEYRHLMTVSPMASPAAGCQATPTAHRPTAAPTRPSAPRVISDCHFAVQLNRFQNTIFPIIVGGCFPEATIGLIPTCTSRKGIMDATTSRPFRESARNFTSGSARTGRTRGVWWVL
jgi:hypothetical protein